MAGSIGAIAGGIISSSAAGDAADAQAGAAAANTKLQKEMYDQTRTDLAPFRDIGSSGAYMLAQLLGLYNPNATSSSKTVIGGNVPSSNTTTNANGQTTYKGTNGDITVLKENEDGQKRIQTPYGTFWIDKNGVPTKGKPGKAETWFMSQGGLNGFSNSSATANAGASADQTAPANFGSLLQNFDNSKFEHDPGYDFRLAEGEKGMNRSLAAQGGLLSGAAVKAASRYNQGFASNEYQNAYNRYTNDQTNIYNRLMGVSNMGQNAAAQQASANQQNANAIGQYNTNAGDARANAAVNQGYFANQGLQGLFNSSYGGGSSFGSGFGPQPNQGYNYGNIIWNN